MRREFEGDMGGRGERGMGEGEGDRKEGEVLVVVRLGGGGDREGDREHFYQTLLCQNF